MKDRLCDFQRDNRFADQFRYLRDDGISEAVGSVHPEGNPIITSKSEGVGKSRQTGAERSFSNKLSSLRPH